MKILFFVLTFLLISSNIAVAKRIEIGASLVAQQAISIDDNKEIKEETNKPANEEIQTIITENTIELIVL